MCRKGVGKVVDEPVEKSMVSLRSNYYRKKSSADNFIGWYLFLLSKKYLADILLLPDILCPFFMSNIIWRRRKNWVNQFPGPLLANNVHMTNWSCDLCWPVRGLEQIAWEGGTRNEYIATPWLKRWFSEKCL